MKNFFLFSSVGSPLPPDYKNQVFDSWNMSSYDSGCVVYDSSDKYEYKKYFKNILYQQEYKFPNFFHYNNQYNILTSYEYVLITDDDLIFNQKNLIEKTIELMNKYNLSICSPSNSCKIKSTPYSIMKTNNEPELWITNFAEMGCLFIRCSFLELFYVDYQKKYKNIKDWGFDFLLASIANSTNNSIGIIKNLNYTNPNQKKRNYSFTKLDNIRFNPVIYNKFNIT
jgi:hypothetical protein